MKLLVLLPLVCFTCLLAEDAPGSSASLPTFDNVNSRYKVESVELSRDITKRISSPVKRDAENLVGKNFDPATAADLAKRIRKELHVVVDQRVEKGQQPDHVRLIYEGRPRRWDEEDAKVTKLNYHQKQGWTGGLEVGADVGRAHVSFGLQSDADRLLERYAGVNAGVSTGIVPDRVRVRFEFETLHEQWNPATELALASRPDVPGIYRERYNLQPEIVILLSEGLSLSAGLSFQQFQTQFPAAKFEAANAVVTTLRHRRRWGASSSFAGHELDAGYSLRAATNLLDSDFVYARHSVDARYTMRHGKSSVTVRGLAGAITGRAPLFERFAIGDTRTLRGWSKFDVNPLGGSRVAYGSVQFRYRFIGVFYDAGTVWDREQPAEAKHSVGVMLALSHRGPFLTVGFPLRYESVSPLFMMGMNF